MSLKLTEAQIQSIILEETKRILSEDEADIRRAVRSIKQEDYAANIPPIFISTASQFKYWGVITDKWIPYFRENPGTKAGAFLSSEESKSDELERWLATTSTGADTNSFNEQLFIWYRHGGFTGAATKVGRFFGLENVRELRDAFEYYAKPQNYIEPGLTNASSDWHPEGGFFKKFQSPLYLKELTRDVQSLIDAVAATSAPEREKEEKSASFDTDHGAYPTEDVKKRGIARFGGKASVAFKKGGEYKYVNEEGLYVYDDGAFKKQETEDLAALYDAKVSEFKKQYPDVVYNGDDKYVRDGIDNTYRGPTSVPGEEQKKFELMPDSALNESQKLHEAMVLVSGETKIPVSAEKGSDEAIPSAPAPGTPAPGAPAPEGTPAAAPATTRRRLYYRGETEEVTRIQKALKELGHDLGSFGPNKDGIDGRFGSATLRAWRKATGLEELPDTAAEAYKAVVRGAETRDQPAVPEEGEEDIRGEVDAQATLARAQQVSQQVDQAMEQYGTIIPKSYTTEDELVSLFPIPRVPQGSSQEIIAKQVEIRQLVGQIVGQRQSQIRKNNEFGNLKSDLDRLSAELSRVEAMRRGGKEIIEKFDEYGKYTGFDEAKGGDRKAKIKYYLAQQIGQRSRDAGELKDSIDIITRGLAKGGAVKEKYDQLYQQLSDLLVKAGAERSLAAATTNESITLTGAQIQQIILEETTDILKKNLNEAASAMGSLGPKAAGAAKSLGSAVQAAYGATRTAGKVAGKPGQAGAGLLKLLGFGVLGRIAAWLFGWPVMIGWQVWDEFVAPFTIEAERGDITKTYKQMADSQEASRMREGIDKASGDFLIKVQEYVKGFKGFSLLDLILDLTGGPINIITNFNTDLVGYITSKFTDNPTSAAIKKRRVEASRQFYKILQEYGPEVRSSEGNIVPNSPQKVQGLEQALNAKISEFLKQEYDVLATTDMVDLIGDSIPTKDEAEAELQAAAKPLIKACLDYYKFIGGAEASQGEEGPAATGPSGSPGAAAGVGAAAGAAAARKVTPKPASYTGRVSELTQKVVDLLKSNGVKDRAQQDAWISWTKEVTKKDKVARDETILDVIEEWFGFTGEKVMRENRHLMEAVGLILPEKGEYEFKDFVEWLEDNNKQSGLPTRYGLHKPRHLRRYLSYVRTFKRNEARAARQDKRSDRINKKVMKNREQILSLQGELESLGDSKKDARKAKRLDTKIKRLTGAAERKEKRAKKVKLRKRDIKNLQEESNKMKIIERDFMSLIEEETQKVVEITKHVDIEGASDPEDDAPGSYEAPGGVVGKSDFAHPRGTHGPDLSMSAEEEEAEGAYEVGMTAPTTKQLGALKLPGDRSYYYKLSPDGKSYTAFADFDNPKGLARGTKLGVFNDEEGLAKVRRAAGLHPDPSREERLSATLASLGQDDPSKETVASLEEAVYSRWQKLIKG